MEVQLESTALWDTVSHVVHHSEYILNLPVETQEHLVTNTNIFHNSSPVRPHQVGQRLVSLTTPDANISRNNSQRTSQKVTLSWRHTFEDQGIFMGATRMAKKPVSNKRLSLKTRWERREICLTHIQILRCCWGFTCVMKADQHRHATTVNNTSVSQGQDYFVATVVQS